VRVQAIVSASCDDARTDHLNGGVVAEDELVCLRCSFLSLAPRLAKEGQLQHRQTRQVAPVKQLRQAAGASPSLTSASSLTSFFAQQLQSHW